jgi:hypothetical protein
MRPIFTSAIPRILVYVSIGGAALLLILTLWEYLFRQVVEKWRFGLLRFALLYFCLLALRQRLLSPEKRFHDSVRI